jgi:RimJ/RimL family protein N-acetyltransferase
MDLQPRTLTGRHVRLEPFTPALKEPVGRALDCDPETWAILAHCGRGEHFAGWWDRMTGDQAAGRTIPFAVVRQADGEVVGTTSWLDIQRAHAGVEIGSTFYRPDARAGVVNPACKRLLLEAAFAAGAQRVQLKVDARNARSQAAVRKLGAVQEGVLRRNLKTWTGYWRDTVVFSILAEEWPSVRAALDARLASTV